jgi:hypothetical protein
MLAIAGLLVEAHCWGNAHNRTVLSPLPESAYKPSGEKATLKTFPVWPAKRASSAPSCRDGKILKQVILPNFEYRTPQGECDQCHHYLALVRCKDCGGPWLCRECVEKHECEP